MGDGKTAKVEAIGTFRLLLKTGIYLDLKEIYVVLCFKRNLISIFVLDKSRYYCSFGNSKVSLFVNSNVIDTGSLSMHDNLYLLDTATSFNETLYTSTRGTKRKLIDKNSVIEKRKLGANRCTNVLELIHTDICGSFSIASWNG